MSNRFSSLASIDAMLDAGIYNSQDIYQALSDLKAMYDSGNITEYQYKNFKSLLEAKL